MGDEGKKGRADNRGNGEETTAVTRGTGAGEGREETTARGREDGENEPSGDQPDDTASAPAAPAATDAAN